MKSETKLLKGVLQGCYMPLELLACRFTNTNGTMNRADRKRSEQRCYSARAARHPPLAALVTCCLVVRMQVALPSALACVSLSASKHDCAHAVPAWLRVPKVCQAKR